MNCSIVKLLPSKIIYCIHGISNTVCKITHKKSHTLYAITVDTSHHPQHQSLFGQLTNKIVHPQSPPPSLL